MHSFIRLYALFFVILLLTIAITGLIVDPDGFFNSRETLFGEKVQKKAQKDPIFTDPQILSKLEIEAVIIGNSRAKLGYNLKTFNSVGLSEKTYRAAIPGMIMAEATLLIDHLKDNQNLTDVFLALDFGMFTSSRKIRKKFLLLKLGKYSESVASFMEKMWLYKKELFSPAAIKSLVMKISSSTDTPGYIKCGIEYPAKTHGQHRLSQCFEKRIAKRHQQISNYPAQLRRFKQAIEALSDMPAKLHIFVNPEHIRMLTIYSVIGKQQNYLQWLDDIIQIMCEQPTRQFQPGLSVFSGANPITTEEFPEMGDTESRMQWYYESSHFKPSAGAMVLQQLITPESRSDHFGDILTCSNRSQFLARFEKNWNEYMATHPEIVKEMTEIVKSTHSENH